MALAKSLGSLDQTSSESGAIWQPKEPAVSKGVSKMAGSLHMVELSDDAVNGSHGSAVEGHSRYAISSALEWGESGLSMALGSGPGAPGMGDVDGSWMVLRTMLTTSPVTRV